MNSKNSQHPVAIFQQLPNEAFVRLPTVRALFACSSATVWRGVRNGRIPKPVKLSERTTGWRVGDLRGALARIAND